MLFLRWSKSTNMCPKNINGIQGRQYTVYLFSFDLHEHLVHWRVANFARTYRCPCILRFEHIVQIHLSTWNIHWLWHEWNMYPSVLLLAKIYWFYTSLFHQSGIDLGFADRHWLFLARRSGVGWVFQGTITGYYRIVGWSWF